MILLSQFKRKMLVKTGQRLSLTPIMGTKQLEFPLNSALHYLSDSAASVGIRANDLMLFNMTATIASSHVDSGYGSDGKPVVRKMPARPLKAYFSRQGNMRKVRNLDRIISKPNQMIVMDYSLLPHILEYRTVTARTELHRFNNILSAYRVNIKHLAEREQFIHIPIDSMIPSVAALGLVSKYTAEQLTFFTQTYQFWIKELHSLAEDASKADVEDYIATGQLIDLPLKDVHVIFTYNGEVAIINLGGYIEQAKDSVTSAQKDLHTLLTKMIARFSETDVDALGTEESTEGVSGVEAATADLVAAGTMTAPEQARMLRLSERARQLPDPLSGKTLEEASVITPESLICKTETNAPVNSIIVDEKMTQSTVSNIRKQYVEDIMQADMINALLGLENAGIVIKDFSITEEIDPINNYRIYRVSLILPDGKPVTLNMPIPTVQPDGTFKADGVRYTMDAQRVDKPVIKTKASEVLISTYPGKLRVGRDERVAHNWNGWLLRVVGNVASNAKDDRITAYSFGNNKLPKTPLARAYTALMGNISVLETPNGTLQLNYSVRHKIPGYDKALEKDQAVVVGTGQHGLLVMNLDGRIWEHGAELKLHGTILEFIGGEWPKAPIDVAVCGIFSNRVPTALVLCGMIGLSKLLRRTGAVTRKLPSNERVVSQTDETAITFKDHTLYVNTKDPTMSLLFAGLATLNRHLKIFNMTDMNRKGGTNSVFVNAGFGIHVAREVTHMKKLFIDPITKDYLKDMNEPQILDDLILKSVYYITTDDSPDKTNPKFKRCRGYERIAGFMYANFYSAIRNHQANPNKGNATLDIKPTQLWQDIVGDNTSQIVQESSPIHNLKEQEAVNLGGRGGRGQDTLTLADRVFHDNDVGIFSEATPDSAKAGCRFFYSPNANIVDVRGTLENYDGAGSTGILSTSALVLPASHHDDGKRTNLANVQQSAVTISSGYVTMPYRTPYDLMIATRTDKEFAFSAEEDGVVTKITKRAITVKYTDGKKDGQRLGVVHGTVAGESIPHRIITDLIVGHEFKKGHLLAWNTFFFERDFTSPANLAMKTGAPAIVAMVVDNDTLEDSDACSPRLAELLRSDIAKQRTVLFNFEEGALSVKLVGDETEADEALCIVATPGTTEITDAALLALATLGSASAKAKLNGAVTRIEVVYMGDLDDMSPTLKEIAIQYDAERSIESKATGGKAALTGRIKRPAFFGGQRVTQNTLAISFHVDSSIDVGTGDKLVVCNQLKTIVGRIMSGLNTTASGIPIDLRFGRDSVDNRIVDSPIIQGVANRTFTELSRQFALMIREG